MMGCAQNNEQPKADTKEQAKQIVPHQTSLTGSLVKNSENTPDQFMQMLVNERQGFKDERNENGNRLEQIISTNDGSLVVVAIWENINQEWRCLGIAINQSKNIQENATRVFMRLPDRLEDSISVKNAFVKLTPYTRLSNGAGLTINHTTERTQYEIY